MLHHTLAPYLPTIYFIIGLSALRLREEVNFTINRKANELRDLNEKLKIGYDELDSFSYTISHDLKNPLSSIKGYARILNRQENLDDQSRQMVERIVFGTVKMQIMIRDVLSYSRAGQTKMNYLQLDLYKILHDIKQELLIGSENKKLGINIENTPSFYGDETMIMQVFSNLIGNAVKYAAKKDSPSVTVNGKTVNQAKDQNFSFSSGTKTNANGHFICGVNKKWIIFQIENQ